MKVYADYGTTDFKALESCVMEVENSMEWVLISGALEKMLEEEEKNLIRLSQSTMLASVEKRIKELKQLIYNLDPKNTISMDSFNIDNLTKSLYSKGY